MVYKKNLVAAIKIGGKVLRESSDRVVLPFGSEYSVLLKNLDSVRVQVKVSIDGQDATQGTWLVIEPNSSLELERFIRNGNFEKGNRFKFIERTDEIEDARGVKVDDGLIRVEYKKEYIAPVPRITYTDVYIPNYVPYYPRPYHWPYYGETWCNSSLSQSGGGNTTRSSYSATNNVSSGLLNKSVQAMNFTASAAPENAGITVPGSESNQKFQTASWFATESQTEVLVLHLVGRKGSEPVKQAVTVDAKPSCVTCHKVNKASSKFCSRCGTSLEII